MTNTYGVGRQARGTARRAANSRWMDRVARLGLAARGLMYVLVGFLAVQVAVGKASQQADNGGALQAVASKPFGGFVLWLLFVGFVGLALWRFSEAAFGVSGAGPDDGGERLRSLGRGIIYTVLAISVFNFVVGASSGTAKSSNQQSQSFTTKAMQHAGGRLLIGAIGIAIVVMGCVMLYEAVQRKFEKYLKTGQMSPPTRKAVETLGVVGGVARGVVFGLTGIFFVIAAATYDPQKAKGLDGTLRSLASTSLGPVLLVLVAIGLIAFGAYSFCEARWRRT